MDEHALIVSGPDPVHELATLLRAVADRPLTPEQSGDLEVVLTELESVVGKGGADVDPRALARSVGDLRIIEVTAEWGSAQATAVSRTQRERIRRLLPALQPDRRRGRPWRR